MNIDNLYKYQVIDFQEPPGRNGNGTIKGNIDNVVAQVGTSINYLVYNSLIMGYSHRQMIDRNLGTLMGEHHGHSNTCSSRIKWGIKSQNIQLVQQVKAHR